MTGDTSGSRLERVAALFDAALALPESLRGEFLQREVADPDLRAEVARLLSHHTEGDASLRQALGSAVASVGARPLPEIGGYRVLRELGAGGMGTVFLAERAIGETSQQVAIKLIRGFPTAEARTRLLRERSLLAGLNHPNIAGLIDAGETADGQPYLVMEYVDGVPLGDYCRQHALDLPARLALFASLCRAVQHAHQRLIVHRDIKPGNVLVRGDGTPVLLDFGIGKLLDRTDADATATRVFTPAYAAPEQRSGRGVTTAADVYGLGCVLFELITGRAIADVGGGERGIPVPSACVSTTQARALRGDLDTLVAKATHAEAERRYGSAQALADDVENFLAGRPLRAAPDSFAYRAHKFLRRHRLGAALTLLAAVAALGFVWRLDAERGRALAAESRAEREAQSARRSRDFLVSLFEAAAPGNALGKALSARELIDQGSAQLEARLRDEPEAAARLGLTIAEVYGALGDPKAAIAGAERALARVAGDAPERALLRADILLTLAAEYDNTERFDEARRAGEDALALRRRYAPDDRLRLAQTLSGLGRAAIRRGDMDTARGYFEQAMAEFAVLPQVAPEDRAEVLGGLSEIAVDQGRLDEAVRRGEEAVQALVGLPDGSPARLESWRILARALVAHDESERAVALLQQAVAVARTALGEGSYKVGNLENDLAVALNGLGRYREAIDHLGASIAITERLRPGDRGASAYDRMNLGSIQESLGDYAAAERLMRAAIADLEAAAPDEPQLDFYRANLGRTLMFRGEYDEARRWVERALAGIAARDGEKSFGYAFQTYRLARIELAAGRLDAAAQALHDSSATLDPMLPPQHALRVQFAVMRGQLARAHGDLVAAQKELADAETMQVALRGSDPVLLAVVRLRRAEVLAAAGDLPGARRALDAAQPVLDSALLPQAQEAVEARALRARLQAGGAAP